MALPRLPYDRLKLCPALPEAARRERSISKVALDLQDAVPNHPEAQSPVDASQRIVKRRTLIPAMD
jgi:hypothetical protein